MLLEQYQEDTTKDAPLAHKLLEVPISSWFTPFRGHEILAPSGTKQYNFTIPLLKDRDGNDVYRSDYIAGNLSIMLQTTHDFSFSLYWKNPNTEVMEVLITKDSDSPDVVFDRKFLLFERNLVLQQAYRILVVNLDGVSSNEFWLTKVWTE